VEKVGYTGGEPVAARTETHAGVRVRVLLIEDDDRDVKFMRESLASTNGYRFELTHVERIAEATKKLTDHRYDVILLDLTLPDAVGNESFLVLRARAPDIPIVVLTDLSEETFAIQAVQQGAQDYIIKGYADERTLVRSIRYSMERAKALSALRDSKDQLLQAQKMEAIGRLAGGIAHDFNNLLTSILGFSHMILDEAREHPSIESDIKEVIKAADRAAKLTGQLLAFSRKQVVQPKSIDLNHIVVEMDHFLRRALGEDIELVTLLGENIGLIEADSAQIEQVIMNLAVNARDAMPKGGRLFIETRRAAFKADDRKPHAALKAGRYVVLNVRDTGCGIPADVMEHMFEAFYTTKRTGTGLGLSMVKGIIDQSHGVIQVESEPNNGASFTVYFPQSTAWTEEIKPQTMINVPRGTETILVVDDESIVRNLVSRILKSLGYTILVAGSGSEALAIWEQKKNPIHLVLTDVVMPHMSGRDLIDRLQTMGNGFKVLYTSGFTQDAIAQHGVTGNHRLLLKPYTRESLARMVREVLDTPS
jgi:two-component system cell cycle sensor histidine kinase/response regulator CckA